MGKRNFGLDFIRSISIWFVILFHAGLDIPGLRILKLGGIGVEIFFVLSGFLIGEILIKQLDKSNSFSSIKNFWIRRWFRILPLYYLVLSFKFILIDHSIGWNILYYIFFLQNNFFGIDFFAVTWSLVIEEWFYLISPFVFLVVNFLAGRNIKKTLALLILYLIGVNMMRGIYASGGVPFEGVNSQFLFRMDSLFVGVFLAYFKLKMNHIYGFLQSWKVFVAGILLFLGYISYLMALDNPGMDMFPKTLGFLLFSLIIGLMVPYIEKFKSFEIKNSGDRQFFNFVNYTSLFTYGIYLIHPLTFEYILNNQGLNIPMPVKFIITIIATYTIAGTVYFLFEERILKFRDKITV